MAPIRPLLAAGVIVVSVLTGCADGKVASDTCGESLTAPAGELRTVLRASYFGADALILESAALPDGSVVVTYDANPEEAGGEENWVPEPGAVLLEENGSCRPFQMPLVDGRRVGLDAQPVAVDDDGRLYLWNHGERQLVRGQLGGAWEKVLIVPSRLLAYTFTPTVAVSPQGEIYIATGSLVSRMTKAGDLEPVAGTGSDPNDSPPGLGVFPRPATSSPLPWVGGIAVSPSGGVVMTTRSAVLELAPSGTLELIADPETTAGQDGAIVPAYDDKPGSTLTAVAITDSGDVLVSDLPHKRILEIGAGRSDLLVEAPSYLSLSRGNALLADGVGLLVQEGGGQALAVYRLPSD